MVANHPQYLNLVFQGGGVRGIAYAGVLENMPGYLVPKAVGGTSAGAIVAGLLAIGKRDLKQYLSPKIFASFLDPEEKARVQRLAAAIEEARTVWTEASRKGKGISSWKAFCFSRRHKQAMRKDVAAVMENRGLYRSVELRRWLDDVFGGKRFKDILTDDLRIVAADIRNRRYFVYTKKYEDTYIAEAVHASTSIPFFFRPFDLGNGALVDGGILSNFPSYLFARTEYPTIGFRLQDIDAPADLQGFGDYLKALLLTMAEAHDVERGDPPHFRSYDIPMPDIPSTRFDLSSQDEERLLEVGRTVGQSVNWRAGSSSQQIVSYYDPKPFDALQSSVKEAHRLYERCVDPAIRPEELHEEVHYTLIIEHEWTARYDVITHRMVTGPRPLLLSRILTKGIPHTNKSDVGVSIVDMDLAVDEVTTDGPKPVIKIPAVNMDDQKGFVQIFIPPIMGGASPRTFRATWSIAKEYASTLGAGRPGSLSYTTVQRADRFSFRLAIRVLIDSSLPELVLRASPGMPITKKNDTAILGSNRIYRSYEGSTDQIQVKGKVGFDIDISLAPAKR